MGRDLYVALAGASTSWQAVDAVANDLANAATAGFRSARLAFGADPATGVHPRAAGFVFDESDGALVADGVPTHLALQGPGMFRLVDGSFTRDGAFRLDEDGTLVTRDGVGVAGEAGPVRLDPGERFEVRVDGTVVGERSGEVGRLTFARLRGATPLGGNRWAGEAEPVGEAPRVTQGALEDSNVDPLRCLAELIEVQRHFEAQQTVMRASDEMTSRLNRIGGS